MTIILLLLDLCLLSFIAWRIYFQQPLEVKSYYWPALIAKLVAGLLVGVVYFYYYGDGDTIGFWKDGVMISESLTSDFVNTLDFYWDENSDPALMAALNHNTPRSLFFTKIAGIAALATGGNYWLMAGLLSFVSFVGSWYLFRTVSSILPSAIRAAAISFLFYPSVLFWSSGLIKESVGLTALYFLAAIVLQVIAGRKVTGLKWILALMALWIGWNLKYYWLGIFMPVAVTLLAVDLLKRLQPSTIRFELGLWLTLFAALLLLATSVHPNFYPHRFLEVIYQSNREFMQLTNPNNAILFYNLEPSVGSIGRNSITALVAGSFRPWVWESHNLLSFLASLENLLLLIVSLLAVPFLRRISHSPFRLLTLSLLTYSILLSVFLALSTPNFGTLSRYKIGFLPFLCFLLLYNNPIVDRLLTRLGLREG